MISIETIKFFEVLNELSARTTEGCIPFSECTKPEDGMFQIVYDDSQVVTDEKTGAEKYRVGVPLIANGKRSIVFYGIDHDYEVFYVPGTDEDSSLVEVVYVDENKENGSVIIVDGEWFLA